MSLKPRYKRRIFWTIISIFGIAVGAIIIIPPAMNLNKLKPKIQQVISEQTGISANIRGDVNFSLLGRATIVAHDVEIPFGTVDSVMISVPLHDIFDLENVTLTGDIVARGAKIKMESLTPHDFEHRVELLDSVATFKGKDYEIIRGVLQAGKLDGTVRTPDHRYDIKFDKDEFLITNRNYNLEIFGHLFADGTARGTLAIETSNINEWFEFDVPRITKNMDIKLDIAWDGEYGFEFTNIQTDDFTGNITLLPDGARDVKLRSDNLDFDFSFVKDRPDILLNAKYDLDFYGKMRLMGHNINHMRVLANGDDKSFNITDIVMDNTRIQGGYIDKNGAHNILITTQIDDVPTTCMFSGTRKIWNCEKFIYDDLSGTINVNGDEFDIVVTADKPMPTPKDMAKIASKWGTRGKIKFSFSNAAGILEIKNGKPRDLQYTFAQNKTLAQMGVDLKFIPEHMRAELADFKRDGNVMTFFAKSGQWIMQINKNDFVLRGNHIKDLFPEMDLRAFKNWAYEISGTYNKDTISNLVIKMPGNEFRGSVTKNAITLKTDLLNLNAIIDDAFSDNYEEMGFLVDSPIMLPFDFGARVSLSASYIQYNDDRYANFVYSLKPNVQTFSVTDAARGGILATITKSQGGYKIFAQLNRFLINGNLLSPTMPLNLRDTTLTGEIDMTTRGTIAHDLEYNLAGTIDISADGGYLDGIGIDGFFAAANKITTFNAEYVLSDALEGGASALKKLHIVGQYSDGNFKTTTPLELQLRHTDAIGNIEISDGRMAAQLKMILRGTSPSPSPIDLQILPDGARHYSLSAIMTNLDPTYMRQFVQTHDRF